MTTTAKLSSIPRKLFAISLIFSSCLPGSKRDGIANGNDEVLPQSVKLTPVVFGGNRYVVYADFGLENKVPLMVHGNANLYLMITHEIAEQLNNGNPITKIRDYGYSEKGLGNIDVKKFQVGDKVFENTKGALVFDWPENEGKSAQGMLGIHFLEKEKVRIDFVTEEMQIGVAGGSVPDKTLTDQGYSFTTLFLDKGEGYMNTYFDAIGKEIPITVGTVSSDFSFDYETFKGGIKTEKTGSKANSPSHTTPELYINTEPIKYRIADQSFEIATGKVSLYSFAEYENVKQTELFPFGIFGRDWMKENSAIIDYANKVLYFKTP